MADSLTVHLVQPDAVWHDVEANLAAVTRMLDTTPPAEGSLVVLPETFSTGFSQAAESFADDERVSTWLCETSSRFGCTVLGGMLSRDGDRGVNVAIAYHRGEQVASYRKRHLFPIGGEAATFAAGTASASTFDVDGVQVCPLICFDLRFPETWRAIAGQADVYCLIANWPASRMGHWHALLRARAIENQAYVVGVNRVGEDPNVEYSGESVVFNFNGDELLRLGKTAAVKSVKLDLAKLRGFREKFPFLTLRVGSG
jgi:predicted amidohydrolase